MKRVILSSGAFVRSARRFVKRHPESAEDIQGALTLLAEDAFDPFLVSLSSRTERCNTSAVEPEWVP